MDTDLGGAVPAGAGLALDVEKQEATSARAEGSAVAEVDAQPHVTSLMYGAAVVVGLCCLVGTVCCPWRFRRHIAVQALSEDERLEVHRQFVAMDLDGSNALDIFEIKVLSYFEPGVQAD